MLPVSCPTNAIVYKASGKLLYILVPILFKDIVLRRFFTLLAKLSGISEYFESIYHLFAISGQMSADPDLFLQG